MPRGDGTGPMGMGPMTGRGMGCCTGVNTPGFRNTMNFGYGMRGSRGFRRNFFAGSMPGYDYNDKDYLSNQKQFLENQLKKSIKD
jgi:hypothetical protein